MCNSDDRSSASTKGVKKVVVLDAAGEPILLAPRLYTIIAFLVANQEALISDTLSMRVDCKGKSCKFSFPQVFTLQAVG